MLDHCMLSKQFQCILTFILKISGSRLYLWNTICPKDIIPLCIMLAIVESTVYSCVFCPFTPNQL